MAPYFCHVSNHMYTQCDDCNGCICVHQWDDYEMPKTPLFGTVPGGHNDDNANRFHRDFDKGMYAYEKARKEGLQPKATSVEAVEAEHNRVRSQQRAVEKLKNVTDVSELSVTKGVEV